ncbi:MAG: GNAT family N-acetyltransferase [Syntrophaceae bacterium]
MEWQFSEFRISTDKREISPEFVYNYLRRSYQSKSRNYEEIRKSIENSLCFGLFHGERQIGFARIVSDLSTIYMLSDVFIVESYRGRGLGKWLMECIVNSPELKNLIGLLATKNAQGLYRKYGFRSPNDPRMMMLRIPEG